MKICAKCDIEKEIDSFNTGQFGVKRVCKNCEENLSLHYLKQQVEVQKELSEKLKKTNYKERLKQNKKDTEEKYKKAEIEVCSKLIFKKNIDYKGVWMYTGEIYEKLKLTINKNALAKVLQKKAMSRRVMGRSYYYISFDKIKTKPLKTPKESKTTPHDIFKLIDFLTVKENGIWQSAKQILEHLKIDKDKGIVYRIIAQNSNFIKTKDGLKSYYIKYKL